MPEFSRDSHPAQAVDATILTTVRAMPALSASEHGDRCKEASDTLYRKYCTKGSRPPTCQQAGFDHRVGHGVVLHVTVESVHASCLRC